MIIVNKISKLRNIIRSQKSLRKSVGLVPTMGALHEGHVSLIRVAREENDIVVVSIFVNSTQFGPKEDFKKYPRNLLADVSTCRNEGVDIIFSPRNKEIYPEGFKTFIEVEGLSNILCGKSRPGHFKGVATIVAKLFNIVQPDNAYFGQKDAQQAAVIKTLDNDLNFPVKTKIMPIVREEDGLAMSSRNIYLNKAERIDALVLFQSLNLAKDLVNMGEKDAEKIISLIKKIVQKRKSARIDYVSIVNQEDFKPVKKITGRCLFLLAVWIGKTRLIDNTVIGKV